MMCEHLEVSSSGYHQHTQREANDKPGKPVRHGISDDALLAHIKAIPAQVKGEYDWPCMWKELAARGIRVGHACSIEFQEGPCRPASGKRRCDGNAAIGSSYGSPY